MRVDSCMVVENTGRAAARVPPFSAADEGLARAQRRSASEADALRDLDRHGGWPRRPRRRHLRRGRERLLHRAPPSDFKLLIGDFSANTAVIDQAPDRKPRTDANEMADYVRLCELGANLERAAARWFKEQVERSVQRAAARPCASTSTYCRAPAAAQQSQCESNLSRP
jgi:hypothetical protein